LFDNARLALIKENKHDKRNEKRGKKSIFNGLAGSNTP
jgi:hypothetical protein